jgi:hypothetical protein
LGTLKWTNIVTGASRFGSPSIGRDGTVYAVSREDGGIWAFDPDGSKLWSGVVGYGSDCPIIGADGTIYVAAGALYAFDQNGTNLWVNHDPLGNQCYAPSPAIGRDGTIYVATSLSFGFSYGVTLYAISQGGTLNWNFKTNLYGGPCLFVSTPTIDSAGNIIITANNTMFAISPQGNPLCSFSPGDGTVSQTSPTIGPDGTIYATFGSRLYALPWTNSLADSPWPMYRQNPRHTGKIEKPSLQKPQKRSDANFQFQLFGQISNNFTIEASTNVMNWTSITSLMTATVPVDIFDLGASNSPVKFYRAVETP